MALPLSASSIVAGMSFTQRVRASMPPSLILQSLICLGSILASKYFGMVMLSLRIAVLRSLGLRMK